MPRYEEDNVPNYAQNILLIILSFIIPPVPIIMLSDNSIFTKECLISVILTLLGHIPGVLFSLYFILIEYPKRAHRHSGRDGYIRIEDEDEIRPIRATDSNQLAQDQQETQGSLLNIPQDNESESPHPPPPNYEDIVGASDGQRDSKLAGDNKVQY
ncbi:unnamed protein product [Debaryomyces tyrocola]|nr:unnamed protein product [Debaryomyces tyrocola]